MTQTDGRRRHKPRSGPSYGHTAPLLASLRARAGLTLQEVADAAGVRLQVVHRAEGGPDGASLTTRLAMAKRCGASGEELRLLEVLHALDRGALPVPAGADVERVRRALDVLDGQEAGA